MEPAHCTVCCQFPGWVEERPTGGDLTPAPVLPRHGQPQTHLRGHTGEGQVGILVHCALCWSLGKSYVATKSLKNIKIVTLIVDFNHIPFKTKFYFIEKICIFCFGNMYNMYFLKQHKNKYLLINNPACIRYRFNHVLIWCSGGVPNRT